MATQTLSGTTATYGISGAVVPTKTRVANNRTIGQSSSTITWSDADIMYSFKLTCTTTSDLATLDNETGTVTATTGSPTRTDNDEDFEGQSLTSIVTLYAIHVECVTGGNMVLGGSFLGDGGSSVSLEQAGESVLWCRKTGVTLSGTETTTFDMNTVGGEYIVTVVGKST